ncbi:putative PEP-binding protein [Brevibacillus marinus]|uniref:putative PEP-binding protein n=1 Tax=Brevibacillus marinus TaxID=2496837 RepID=UPI000F8338D9|nr:putative PEP-binding protein [Brevibacillus marinus]
MLKVKKEQNIADLLEQVAKNQISPEDVLFYVTERDLMDLLSPSFIPGDNYHAVGHGDSILPGDVTGQLVLDRQLGEFLLREAEKRNTSIDLIYSRGNGNLEDFYVLKSSKGFFTNQRGRTTFCPVQASCEGVPTLVGVNCKYDILDHPSQLTYTFNDGSTITIEQPRRAVIFEQAAVKESEWVSLSANKGLILKGRLESRPSDISKLYDILADCYLEALETYEFAKAEAHIIETSCYRKNKDFLVSTAESTTFKGFQVVKNAAHNISHLKVFATAHTSKAVALTKLFSSDISVVNGDIQVKSNADLYGIGLLRDERMWNKPADIDLMRIVFLGQDVIGDQYLTYKEHYLQRLTDMMYDVFQAGTGEIAVVRLLCMPYNMIFPQEFNISQFSQRYGLPEKAVEDRIRVLANETETYHGCRGVRVTVQREDICKLWCEGVINAAKKADRQGIPVKLQVLLSMVTFPQEVSMFINTFEQTLKDLNAQHVVRGISVMIETSGSFHLAEDILNVKGEDVEVNGALFGGNDFTAACLNMNRSDSAVSIIPEYIKLNIMPTNPFQSLNEQIVGKAIVQTLKRANLLQRRNKRHYLMGLGGEIAGSWESVTWLAKHAAPHGLRYVSTPPDRIFYSLFASAQSTLHTLH